MNQGHDQCERQHLASAFVLQALTPREAAAAQAHLATCPHCRREAQGLRPVVERFVSWPTDVLRPTSSLQERLALRIAVDTGRHAVRPAESSWSEPDWEQVAPGIECKLLAADAGRSRVSMLVRLAPGASYPPHTHAGAEELHLLHGELWIDDRKLTAGDYNAAVEGTSDQRVWSETGCTCLLTTSTKDVLR
jgi:anti-sigma factor ChrR (cupin superfamily)